MDVILKFIGACVLAAIILAIPTLIPISILLHWGIVLIIWNIILVVIEVLLFGIYIFDNIY